MAEGIDPGAPPGPRTDNGAAINRSGGATDSVKRRGAKRSAESGVSPDKTRKPCSRLEHAEEEDNVDDTQQTAIEDLLRLMQVESLGRAEGPHAVGKYRCHLNACVRSFPSAPKFLDHMRSSHPQETALLHEMKNHKLVIRCHCGDFRWCRRTAREGSLMLTRWFLPVCLRIQCRIIELPWALATFERLMELSQPGLVCFHVGKGMVINRRIASTLSQLFNYESETVTPIQRWVMVLLLPLMILHVPSQKMDVSTRKKLEKDRMDSFRRGEWQQLFDSALETIKRQQGKLQEASVGEYRGETEYLGSKIAKGQVSDALGKQAKPTLLSQQRIEFH